MRPEPEAAVLHWMTAQTDALYVTALSYAEILLGIDLLPQGQRRQLTGRAGQCHVHRGFCRTHPQL